MKKIKLVICDIDGTLIVKHETLTPRAKKAINELRQKGIYFGVASGRPLYQIRYSLNEWGFNDFDIIIGLNGSSLWNGIEQKEYSYYKMKKEWIKETIDLMKPFPSNPSIYKENKQLFFKEDEMFRMYAEKTGLEVEVAKSIEDLYQEDNAKIMFRVSELDMPEIEKMVKRHHSDSFVGFKTSPIMMEFCDKRINKGDALIKFCQMNNISLNEVVAFGDTTNDNEMLITAGLGVCMHNGSEDTKSIADCITEKNCDEDGWADYMEQHIMSWL